MNQNQRVALIIGGGSGLGKAACIRLAMDGVVVCVADRELKMAKQTAREILEYGKEAAAFEVDINCENSVNAMFDGVIEAFGKLNYLFATEAIEESGNFFDLTFEQWRRVMDVNLDGKIFCCQRAVKEMLSQGKENGPYSILLNVSDGACAQDKSRVAVCTSEWGVRGFMRSLALNLAKEGITVNTVASSSESKPPLEELAGIVSFVFSDEARNITGTTIMDNNGTVMI